MKGVDSMLNHKDKYTHFQLYQQTDSQKLYTASKKTNPEEQVILNVIPKTALAQPLDVHGVINATQHLEMLEEDNEHWYFVTRHLEGEPVFARGVEGLVHASSFTTDHLLQLLNLVKSYDYLTPYYQMILLNEKQFIISNNQLETKEVFDLSVLSSSIPDFSASLMQLSLLVKQSVDLLKVHYPETYAMVNWHLLFEKAALCHTLNEVGAFWEEEIQALTHRVKPELLENLYAIQPVKNESSSKANAQKNYQSLQNEGRPSKKKMNTAILITCILALLLAFASFAPLLKDLLSGKGTQNESAIQDKNQAPASKDTTNSSSAETVPQDSTTGDSLKAVTTSPDEQLDPDQIVFLTDNWLYSSKELHTGDLSLKLTLDQQKPSGKFKLSGLDIPKDSSFSLWMRSSESGSVLGTFVFYKSGKVLKSYESTLNFETADQWFLMNPLSGVSMKTLSEADSLEIEFEGSPQVLWLDDILFESYK